MLSGLFLLTANRASRFGTIHDRHLQVHQDHVGGQRTRLLDGLGTVTGLPDDVRGQLVKATVVLAPGYEPSEKLTKELQAFVRELTAPYKYPRVIDYVADLPKTISGKIKRKEIREADLAKLAK